MGLLRLLLALTVAVYHSGSTIFSYTIALDSECGPTVAVQTFFIISGFYMALILNEKYTGAGSYRLFISNRFLRLYPAYWAVLILTVAGLTVCYVLGENAGALGYFIRNYNLLNIKAVIFLIGTQLIILGQELVALLGFDPGTGSFYFAKGYWWTRPQLNLFLFLNQMWTVSIELMFYLLAPLLVRKNIYVLLSVIIPSLMLRVFMSVNLGLYDEPWIHHLFFTQIAFFMFGVISYKIYAYLKARSLPRGVFVSVSAVLLGITMLYQFIPVGSIKQWCYYLLVIGALPFVFSYTKDNKIDQRIGDLSYPVYISHFLILYSTLPFLNRLKLAEYGGFVTSVVTILFSIVLIKLIIDPIERYRQGRVQLLRTSNFLKQEQTVRNKT
jgi:peptidoglycan/LPS O-acetylase OafA/YrhL